VDFDEVADEAFFLWGQWERTLRGGTSTLIHFVDGLDERFLASEETLGGAPPSILRTWFAKALDGSGKKNDVGALALALLVSGAKGAIESVAQALESHPKHRGQLARALEICWTDIDHLLIGWLRAARSAPAVGALLRALAFRAVNLGTEIDPFLRAEDEDVLVAALGCLPFSDVPDLRGVEQALRSERETVREAAREAALRIDPRLGLRELRQAFDRRQGPLDLASMALAISASPEDLERLEQAAAEPALRRQAIWALGIGGWVVGADVCLRALNDDTVIDLAAEGFEAISGIRLASAAVPADEAGEGEASEPANITTPWAAPAFARRPAVDSKRAASEWSSRKQALGARVWAGAPLAGESLVVALKREPLRRRHARALELEVRSHGEVRLRTLDWGWRQLRDMGRLQVPARVSFQAPLDRMR
jgi:uncharacterized protein (TIGR02270 family)